ncbi:MAG TPA: helix-turn-helix transcriptional regulator [Thermoanaerobaculia bacterium]|nr:helix-turn-helix transcriptional regulator [Thermoanaerobaculia bacterium]
MRNRIRDLREARRWTQTDLAQLAGVTRQAIHAIERNKHDPSLTLAARIARALGQPLDHVFHLDELGGDRR